MVNSPDRPYRKLYRGKAHSHARDLTTELSKNVPDLAHWVRAQTLSPVPQGTFMRWLAASVQVTPVCDIGVGFHYTADAAC